MDSWLSELRDDLGRLESQDLLRRLRAVEHRGRLVRHGGREMINLAGNDYLGLAGHPRLREAAIEAIRTWGVGAGASRLVSGHTPVHAGVESRFASFKHAQAALIFPTGYAANLAAITALARPGDLVCVDKLNHASLLDAAAASGAQVRVYPHLNLAKLDRLLARAAGSPIRRFILTDSIFSMDGDVADLPALCDLADRYDAILLVDEAHGTGVLGASGAGLAELQGVAERLDLVVSTASKALGSLGGIVTARQEVIQTLVNRARSFIYSTGVPAAQAATIDAALAVIHDEPWRRDRLKELSQRLRHRLGEMGWLPAAQAAPAVPTPIIALVVGAPAAALALAARLDAAGFLAPAIRPPTVAPGSSRVRLSLRADLQDDDLERLCATLPPPPAR